MTRTLHQPCCSMNWTLLILGLLGLLCFGTSPANADTISFSFSGVVLGGPDAPVGIVGISPGDQYTGIFSYDINSIPISSQGGGQSTAWSATYIPSQLTVTFANGPLMAINTTLQLVHAPGIEDDFDLIGNIPLANAFMDLSLRGNALPDSQPTLPSQFAPNWVARELQIRDAQSEFGLSGGGLSSDCCSVFLDASVGQISQVPEPSAMTLLGAGLLALVGLKLTKALR